MSRHKGAREPGRVSESRSTDVPEPEENAGAALKHVKRHASVYDAVAGRVGLNGFLPRFYDDHGNEHVILPRGSSALAPHEVLLRRTSAPLELESHDYFADEQLLPDQTLPESDLLKAVHAYASDFYRCATDDHGRCDFRSMNETALLAVGILLEEAAVEALGENGDMVLVEPEGLDNLIPESRTTKLQVHGMVKPIATPSPAGSGEDDVESEESDQPRRKRGRRFD